MNTRNKKIAYAVCVIAGLGLFAALFVHARYGDLLSTRSIGIPDASMTDVSSLPATTTSSQTASVQDAVPSGSASVESSTPSVPKTTAPHIIIPAIKVNALIENVGRTATGNMDVPLRLADVGWYKYGTRPGDIGSAVFSGHVDDSLGLPAVFYHLKEMKNGDDVYITQTNGQQLHFVVTDVADYPLATAPVNEIFNDKSGRIIRLITCQASYASGSFAYDHRVVVTAKLV